jgi:hypothetical protein
MRVPFAAPGQVEEPRSIVYGVRIDMSNMHIFNIASKYSSKSSDKNEAKKGKDSRVAHYI